MGERKIEIIGDRVYRPAAWWTPAVHGLLEHLHAVGFDRVPRPLAVEAGREVVGHIPGDSGPAGWARVVPERGLRAFARLLRDFHDATRSFVPPRDAEWALRYPAGDVVCHGDFGPWNVVWRGLEPVGLLDFDFAAPGSARYDVAYALEYATPFRDDSEALRWHGFDVPPGRRRRMEVFLDAYGYDTTPDAVAAWVDEVVGRQGLDAVHVRALADRGLEPQRTWVREGALERYDRRVRWSNANRDLFR
ncbi:phosphotransferase family enzyme [Saccharothrix saharensis]|uniref:Phosphotransferase family enzyme n=1 Tax=Saccharothrix saharensis TaxID=571190 RepID=A0A543JBM3_9PSEU|nr:aminoglycoside phosphotransferase family protein [Saccharothrix saharensis]TQM80240.1 phosphotransferase family enzyme [Saccharothrix saharensis]